VWVLRCDNEKKIKSQERAFLVCMRNPAIGENILDNQVCENIIAWSLADLAMRGSGGQMRFISSIWRCFCGK
jgi:hypothetical protein